LVIAPTATPVPDCVAVTVAPGMTAFDESRTVPTMLRYELGVSPVPRSAPASRNVHARRKAHGFCHRVLQDARIIKQNDGFHCGLRISDGGSRIADCGLPVAGSVRASRHDASLSHAFGYDPDSFDAGTLGGVDDATMSPYRSDAAPAMNIVCRDGPHKRFADALRALQLHRLVLSVMRLSAAYSSTICLIVPASS